MVRMTPCASIRLTPRPTLIQAIQGIKEELRWRLDQLHAAGRLLEAQRLEQRTLFDLEMLEATGSCAGIENYSRYLTGRRPGEPPPKRASQRARLKFDRHILENVQHVMMCWKPIIAQVHGYCLGGALGIMNCHDLVFAAEEPDNGELLQNLVRVAFKQKQKRKFFSENIPMNGMLAQIWAQDIPRDLPPLTDAFAPVEHYTSSVVTKADRKHGILQKKLHSENRYA